MSTTAVFRPTLRCHPVVTMAAAGLLLMLALLPLSIRSASAQPVLSNSLSIQAAPLTGPSTLLAIHGDGFSPYGLVFITVTDNAGSGLNQHLWTVASNAVYGPNGSQDPARGYVAAGTINEVIALDARAEFGPNGSQDPYWGADIAIPFPPAANGSQGYDDGSRPPTIMDLGCQHYLTAQAYDSGTQSWTTQSVVALGC